LAFAPFVRELRNKRQSPAIKPAKKAARTISDVDMETDQNKNVRFKTAVFW
jgi:hypothetical protein